MWTYAKQYVDVVDYTIYTILYQLQMIDKIRIAMFVTWLWALVGLYTTKIFETFFRILLHMPDNWLTNSYEPEGLKILHASNGQKNITNKFRLFLKYYWETDEQGSGFNFASLQRLLNCSMLYCSYLLTNKDGTINPDRFCQNINRFLVEIQDGTTVQRTTPNADAEEVPFGQVQFKQSQIKRDVQTINNEMRNSLLAIIEPNIVSRIANQFENK